MLSVYTNNKELLKATSTTPVSRIESVDKELLDIRQFSLTFKDNSRPTLEFHVYTPDGVYLTGNHSSAFSVENNDGPGLESELTTAYQHLSIDTNKELETLGITRGSFKLVYNLFDNVVGAYDAQKMWIKEISPSRRELRLQLADNTNTQLVSQLATFKDRWDSLTTNDIFDSFLINFGFNETYQIINVRFDINSETPEIVVKLYNPLPAKYGEKSKVWISEEVINPILDSISIIPKHIPEPVTNLKGPNFELEEYDGGSIATNFKSWNDLLTSNISTSQQLIDAQFSGSLSGIKLNINYRNFEDFVHYSSAVERVQNFKYKMELIEYYSDRINTVSLINGGDIANNNLSDLYTTRNRVVSGFDDFEKYLFFESTGSKLYTHYDSGTGSVDPWPKQIASNLTWMDAWMAWSSAATAWNIGAAPDPYGYFSTQVSTTSLQGEAYFADLLEKAQIYDKFNIHKLQNTVPAHIQNSEYNDDYVLFVNMLGQHFDIIWTYIKSLTTIKSREEHPKDGMPNDLLYHVANSLGFNLLNGKSTTDLWKYSLGIDENGTALASDLTNIKTLSDEENTKEIWRRIVNNLPYILKTKGTSRSVKALLTCFGIPSTILSIKEYGGPSTFTENNHYPEYIHDVYHNAFFIFGSTGSIEIPISQYDNGIVTSAPANVLEFRVKTDSNYTYNVGNYYGIADITNQGSANSYSLVLSKETNDDNEGTLTLFSTATGNAVSASNLEIFDDSWHSVIIEESNGSASLKVAKTLYGNKIYIKSASLAGSNYIFPTASIDTIKFGTTASFTPTITLSNGAVIGSTNRFNGHLHEIRLWSGSLNDNTIIEHAASPATYTYNVDRFTLSTGTEAGKPYDHLLQRFTLAETQILSGSFYQKSVHPKQTKNTGSLYFMGYTNSGSIKFEGFEETYYTPSPSLGGSSLYTNKVRIESSSLDPNLRLNTKTRVERSSLDKYSIDSNRLGIYFSPQTAINEDIFNQLGYFEIDDYIGNPGDTYKDYYSDLNNFAIQYWKKYENRNDFEAYFRALEIYDFTLFKYLKRLLPQRTNAILGLVVEPNVLERSKVRLLNKPKIEDLTKQAHIDRYEPTLEGLYQDIDAIVEWPREVISEVDPIKIGEIDGTVLTPSSTVDAVKIGEFMFSPTMTSELDQISRGDIEGVINVDRLRSNWVQHRYIGQYKITESGSYSPLQTTVYDSRLSTYQTYLNEERFKPVTVSTGSVLLTSNVLEINNLTSNKLYRLTIMFGEQFDDLMITTQPIVGPPGFIYVIPVGTYSNKLFDIEFRSTAERLLFSNLEYVPDQIEITSYTLYEINYADVNNFHGLGHENSKFNGSKLVGPAVNVDTPNTVDGGPVVKVTKVNPNQIVFAGNQLTTINQSVTGVKKKSI